MTTHKPNDPTKYEPSIELPAPASITIKLGVDTTPALAQIGEAIGVVERLRVGERRTLDAVREEREACAKIVEAFDPNEDAATIFVEWVYTNPGKPATDYAIELGRIMRKEYNEIAEAIRKRGGS